MAFRKMEQVDRMVAGRSFAEVGRNFELEGRSFVVVLRSSVTVEVLFHNRE